MYMSSTIAAAMLAASLSGTPTTPVQTSVESVTPATPTQTTVATIQGWQGNATDFNDASIFFNIGLSDVFKFHSGTDKAMFDTGAVALQIPLKLGQQLDLPYERSDTMTGLVVGAVEDTYDSHVNITIGGKEYDDVPCVVGGGLDFVIFGMQFMRDNHYNADVNLDDNVVTITQQVKQKTTTTKH